LIFIISLFGFAGHGSVFLTGLVTGDFWFK
jgi:hypothetical protein